MSNMWSIPNPYAADKPDFGSISFDKTLYFQDIECSMAHAAMLGGVGLIDGEMSDKIIESLGAVLDELDMGKIAFDDSATSVRAFLDKLLDERIEGASELLNSFRSENERTSGALRLYLRDEWMDMRPTLVRMLATVTDTARSNATARFSQTLIAFGMMIVRDIERMNSACEKMNRSPLGATSPDGTASGIDRLMMCSSLGFVNVAPNSLDALTDCDFCAETVSHLSIMASHLARFVSSLEKSRTDGEISLTLENTGALRRLLSAPEGSLPLALSDSRNFPISELGDMSMSAQALITAVESMKKALKLLTPALSSLSVSENAEKIEIGTVTVERQLEFIASFAAKQNDGSGRY